MKKLQVLFICLGNICRSPTAEAVFNSIIERENLASRIKVDSAGTSGHHEGEEADPRTIGHAQKRGYKVTSISRPFLPESDFKGFDYILTMDKDNYTNILEMDPQKSFTHKVFLMTQFCTSMVYKEVPDPYYGGPESFELVIDILEDACQGLLHKIKTDHKL